MPHKRGFPASLNRAASEGLGRALTGQHRRISAVAELG